MLGMAEIVQSHLQAFEMRYFRKIKRVTMFDKLRFKITSTSSRYVSLLKDLSLEGFVAFPQSLVSFVGIFDVNNWETLKKKRKKINLL